LMGTPFFCSIASTGSLPDSKPPGWQGPRSPDFSPDKFPYQLARGSQDNL
jgi:hypothetical protein